MALANPTFHKFLPYALIKVNIDKAHCFGMLPALLLSQISCESGNFDVPIQFCFFHFSLSKKALRYFWLCDKLSHDYDHSISVIRSQIGFVSIEYRAFVFFNILMCFLFC